MAIGYVLCLHVLLLVFVLRTNLFQAALAQIGIPYFRTEPTEHYKTMLTFHLLADGHIPDGSVLFIGDSFVQGLCVQAVTHKGVNLGIGTDTVSGVAHRLPLYKSLKSASAIVLAIGVNDLSRRSDHVIIDAYRLILAEVPQHVPIVISGILPVDESAYGRKRNERIKKLNGELKNVCSSTQNCHFIDSGDQLKDLNGNLKAEYHTGDGMHLNTNGYRVWIGELKEIVTRIENEARVLRTGKIKG